jgi:hypothetical protein
MNGKEFYLGCFPTHLKQTWLLVAAILACWLKFSAFCKTARISKFSVLFFLCVGGILGVNFPPEFRNSGNKFSALSL